MKARLSSSESQQTVDLPILRLAAIEAVTMTHPLHGFRTLLLYITMAPGLFRQTIAFLHLPLAQASLCGGRSSQ